MIWLLAVYPNPVQDEYLGADFSQREWVKEVNEI